MTEPISELFNYNKEAFKFNAQLHQKAEFQKQKMRVRQFGLYRQDLRDLFNLTIGRMDMYMIVNVLFLGICVEMFYKGRSPVSTPNFIFWLWSVSLASSMFYLLLGLWFALHASVDAQTFSARTLTQWLRLPIPGAAEIAQVTHFVEEFEHKGVNNIFRVPLASNQSITPDPVVTLPAFSSQPRVSSPSGLLRPSNVPEQKEWTEFREHFVMFRAIHKKWVVAEAFARVATVVGTDNLLFAIIYFGIMTYGLDLANPWVGWGIAFIGIVALWLHIRLNLVLSKAEGVVVLGLTLLGPILGCVAAGFENKLIRERVIEVNATAGWLGVAAVSSHLVLSGVFLYLSTHTVDDHKLPKKFSTVWAVDVLAIAPEVDARLMRTRYTRSQGRVMEESTTDDKELRKAVRDTEKILQQLFTYWHVNNARLSDEEVNSVIELKDRFNQERSQVRRMMSSLTVNAGAVSHAFPGWVKLAYQPDVTSKRTVPYFMNPETGELRWDLPEMPENFDVQRGISTLPETLADYRSAVKAVEERKKEKRLLRETSASTAATITPRHLFIYGTVVICSIWLAALLMLMLQLLGVNMGGQLA